MIGLETSRGRETNLHGHVSRHSALPHIMLCFCFQYNNQLIALSPNSGHVVLNVVLLTSFHCDVTTAQ